ncbi:MAG: hypothetical protein HeimAB125_12670 [Candidatus Heimdallarchaeota archaeon AB_125]|nr:MAG: hypothetical protein HeimAB125_12670 [Candidatus Heimdallarchaeota archaeon AB_125]
MSSRDPYKQNGILQETLKKVSELLPSVRLEQPPIEKALIILKGTSKSRTAVLLAGELNKHFNTKIEIIYYFSEQSRAASDVTRVSYEDSLAFTHKHLRSEIFEIKGPVVENRKTLKKVLDDSFKKANYDLIIIPSSFIGMQEEKMDDENLEESEAKVVIIGEIFEYLLEEVPDIPVLVVESEKIDLNMLWNNICIFLGNSIQLSHMCETALRYSLKNTEIRGLINISRSFHEEDTDVEFEQFINKNEKELSRFEKANSDVFKEVKKFKDFTLMTVDKIGVIKNQLEVCGKDYGFLMIYMPTKHSSLAGFFIEFLEDPTITCPILIVKRKIKPPILEKPKEKISKKEKKKKK